MLVSFFIPDTHACKKLGQNTQKRKKQVITRKQRRKEERQQIKQRRAAFFFSNQSSDLPLSRKRPADNHNHRNEPVQKKVRLTEQPAVIQQPHTKLKGNPSNPTTLRNQRSSKGQGSQATSEPNLRTSRPSRRSSSNILTDPSHGDCVEDASIAWLESKLGITKGSSTLKKPNSFGDGLDGAHAFNSFVY